MSPRGYKVPRRKVAPRATWSSRYTPVWEYLETILEYENLKSLRVLLVQKFGEDSTPSLSLINRHLMQNRGNHN